MVLDNDTRGWVMAIVSGIGAFVFGCVYMECQSLTDEGDSLCFWR
jgi:hypothetical protein